MQQDKNHAQQRQELLETLDTTNHRHSVAIANMTNDIKDIKNEHFNEITKLN